MHFCAGRCFYHGCSFSAGFLGAYNISDRRVVDPHPSFSNMLRLFHGFTIQGNFLWHYIYLLIWLFILWSCPGRARLTEMKTTGFILSTNFFGQGHSIIIISRHIYFTWTRIFWHVSNFMTVWVAQLTKHITKKNLNDLPRRLTLFALVCLFF